MQTCCIRHAHDNMSHRYDGKRADVWSLGVCLFALVLGIFPLEEASEEDEIGPRSPENRPSSIPTECRAGLPSETTQIRTSGLSPPPAAQASDKDPRLEALKRAQLENRSSVESILCLYRREDKLSPALTARDCPRLPEVTRECPRGHLSSPLGSSAGLCETSKEGMSAAQALLDGMLLVDPSTRLTMADVQVRVCATPRACVASARSLE